VHRWWKSAPPFVPSLAGLLRSRQKEKSEGHKLQPGLRFSMIQSYKYFAWLNNFCSNKKGSKSQKNNQSDPS